MLARNKLAIWHNLNKKNIKKLRNKNLLTYVEQDTFLKNLYKIGYKDIKGLQFSKNLKYLTIAFQRRFRQSLVDGNIDRECLLISKNLLK